VGSTYSTEVGSTYSRVSREYLQQGEWGVPTAAGVGSTSVRTAGEVGSTYSTGSGEYLQQSE